MEQHTEVTPGIFAEFRKRRIRQLIAVVPFLAAILPLLLLEDAGTNGLFGIPAIVLGPVCIALAVVMLIFSFMNWRCPACNRYLGKAFNPKFCQKCGIRLQA